MRPGTYRMWHIRHRYGLQLRFFFRHELRIRHFEHHDISKLHLVGPHGRFRDDQPKCFRLAIDRTQRRHAT